MKRGGGVPGAEKTIDMRTSERIAVAKELALLSPEECQASQLLFGQEVGSCGRCGRSLSDEVSCTSATALSAARACPRRAGQGRRRRRAGAGHGVTLPDSHINLLISVVDKLIWLQAY